MPSKTPSPYSNPWSKTLTVASAADRKAPLTYTRPSGREARTASAPALELDWFVEVLMRRMMPKNGNHQSVQWMNGLSAALPRTRPIYRQLVALVEGGIARGEVPPGFRLPPERDLARRLRVSRATVVSAYRELEARGLLRGYVGRGTFVSAKPDAGSAPFAWRGKMSAAALNSNDTTVRDLVSAAADPALVSLAAGVPALDCFPTAAFQHAMKDVLGKHAAVAWRHGPTEGLPAFRAALTARYRVPIVEDDTYRELALGAPAPPPLFKLDDAHRVVIRVNSFSKMLAPGLRLGWISAVRPIVEQLSLIKQQVDPHTQNLSQLVVCELIGRGVFDRHVATIKTEHRRPRDAKVGALRQHVPAGALRFDVPDGGMYLWCQLQPGVRARAVQDHARRESVMVVTGEPFYVDQGGADRLPICYTSQPPERADRAARPLP